MKCYLHSRIGWSRVFNDFNNLYFHFSVIYIIMFTVINNNNDKITILMNIELEAKMFSYASVLTNLKIYPNKYYTDVM